MSEKQEEMLLCAKEDLRRSESLLSGLIDLLKSYHGDSASENIFLVINSAVCDVMAELQSTTRILNELSN